MDLVRPGVHINAVREVGKARPESARLRWPCRAVYKHPAADRGRHWQKISGGDWAAYAADISRRGHAQERTLARDQHADPLPGA